LALVASFVSTHVYYASLEDGNGGVVDRTTAWMMVGSLSSAWALNFAAFLLFMKKSYLSTFFSLQTGHAWVKAMFLECTDDRQKIRTLRKNKKQWLSIRPDVKAWTLENWERWEEERPEWFNDAWKAGVDDDMIPPASLRALSGVGSERRRSSLGDVLGVGARVAPVGGGDT
jgi:hypothetical protein